MPPESPSIKSAMLQGHQLSSDLINAGLHPLLIDCLVDSINPARELQVEDWTATLAHLKDEFAPSLIRTLKLRALFTSNETYRGYLEEKGMEHILYRDLMIDVLIKPTYTTPLTNHLRFLLKQLALSDDLLARYIISLDDSWLEAEDRQTPFYNVMKTAHASPALSKKQVVALRARSKFPILDAKLYEELFLCPFFLEMVTSSEGAGSSGTEQQRIMAKSFLHKLRPNQIRGLHGKMDIKFPMASRQEFEAAKDSYKIRKMAMRTAHILRLEARIFVATVEVACVERIKQSPKIATEKKANSLAQIREVLSTFH